MEKYFKRKAQCSTSESEARTNTPSNAPRTSTPIPTWNDTPRTVDVDNLPWDPSERPKILSYDPNQRDEIRRLYWLRGPCQPRGHVFPTKQIGSKLRRFVPTWFDEFHWLEYSVKADKAYCLCCYLFKDEKQQFGSDAFVTDGFNNWAKKERLSLHVGEVNSIHNRAQKNCEALVQQNQSIVVALHKQTEKEKIEYRMRLNASIDVCRLLLKFGLPFRGHDESETSLNQGLFLGHLEFLGDANEMVRKVILDNAPRNCQLTSPRIQKDIANCFAEEVIKSFTHEIGNGVFSLLVDESSDISRKEQMATVLRYVDARGHVKERFVGLLHVTETSSETLKSAIDDLFAKLGLSLKQVRGQGYDGASNMRGEFKGLKALVLQDNSSAYYVHCFAHQLQLVVVAVAKDHPGVWKFFEMISLVCNVVNGSCKRKDMMRESYKSRVQEALGAGEIESGKGLNQELSLTRAGDTRWGSHQKSIVSLINLFPDVVKLLHWIWEEGDGPNRSQAHGILEYFQTFDFVLYLHLMLDLLVVTNSLSKSLQKKDQNILDAALLIEGTKAELQVYRESGFETLLTKVELFCDLHDIQKKDMADEYVNTIRTRHRTHITNRHHYEYDVFNTVMDLQIREFGDRFSEVSTELIKNMAALSPRASFAMFNKQSFVKLCDFYPNDFNAIERAHIVGEIDLYIRHVHEDEIYANLNGIDELARLMVETTRNLTFPLVYRLLKLALTLPVATASVERCFSTMKLVKTYLRNRMGDEFLNAAVVCAVEKEALRNVKNDDAINRFQKMRSRREQL